MFAFAGVHFGQGYFVVSNVLALAALSEAASEGDAPASPLLQMKLFLSIAGTKNLPTFAVLGFVFVETLGRLNVHIEEG